MQVHNVEADILEFRNHEMFNPEVLSILGHAVNCRGVQGAGLALGMKRHFPSQFNQYVELCHTYPKNKQYLLLGTAQLVDMGDNFMILNAFTQVDYGRRGVYTYNSGVFKAFTSLSEQLKELVGDKPVDVYLPFNICCGLAGGDWSVVLPIIQDCMKNTNGRLIFFKK